MMKMKKVLLSTRSYLKIKEKFYFYLGSIGNRKKIKHTIL